MKPSFLPPLLAGLLPCLLLCHCQRRPAPDGRLPRFKETRPVLYERYYTLNGHRMVERRVLVTRTPRLETEIYSEALD